jgi:hypothetical protein
MSEELGEQKCLKLMCQIKSIEHNNIDLERTMNQNKVSIKALEWELWHTCDHQWKKDPYLNFDDLCKFFCKKCGLWRDKSFYVVS